MTGQDSKEIGRKLFKERQYAAAVKSLVKAVEIHPEELDLWSELVLAASFSDQHESAIEFAKMGIRHHPRSDWLWRQLGNELTQCGKLGEAEKALANSKNLNPNAEWLWRYYAALHKKNNNTEKEIEAWLTLRSLGKATSNDLNSLGIAYHGQKAFAKALEFYRLSTTAETNAAALFNMGLVFNDSEVSQDLDAADVYRRILRFQPDYERASERLTNAKRKLIPLAGRARQEGADLLQPSEFYQFYLNPFEVFQIESIEDFDGVDAKRIQRAKKKLLQEIELNDGKVAWLGDFPLDRSRALSLEDELLDPVKREYHWVVFENKPLLEFLTRGEIEHFLYSDEHFPIEVIELLNEDSEFCAFLSQSFAKQYNLLLTRALQRGTLNVIEALFDGRRWVESSHDDLCFEGAFKWSDQLLKAVVEKTNEGDDRKISLREMEAFLLHKQLPALLNLLPVSFATTQKECVAAIRSLAVSTFNKHGDSELSKAILQLCKRFTSRSVDLSKRLDEDFKTIEGMIAEERKHEARLQFGNNRPFSITKEGVRYEDKFFPADQVESLRWGITITGYEGAEKYEYYFNVWRETPPGFSDLSPHNWIDVSWTSDKAGEPKQSEHFSNVVNAALHYLGILIVEKMHKRLMAGHNINIGPCTLTKQGIHFQTQGFFFKKDRFIPWREVVYDKHNGNIVLSSPNQNGAYIAVPIRSVSNAVLLPFVAALLSEENHSR